MQIKEAAAICGLTEKAIRLYEAKGLISPEITEINGRKFRDYSDDDIRTLKTIAGLRQSYFSIEQIAGMQSDPASIPTIFEDYKKEMAAQCGTLETLLARMEAVDAKALSSATALAGALSDGSLQAAEKPALSGSTDTVSEAQPTDTPTLPYENSSVPDTHIRVWDEETPPDLRDAAHRQSRAYVEQWERDYERELFFGKLVRRVLIPIAVAVAIALALYYIPFVSTVDVTYRGYDLKTSPDLWQQAADALGNVPMTEELLAEIDPRTLPVIEDAEAVELQLKGKVYRYLFRDTYFQGSLFSEDYLYRSSDPYPILFVAPITGAMETITPTNGMMRPTVNDGTPICFAAVNGTPGSGNESLIFGLGGTHIDLDTVSPEETDVNRLIVLPAETVEDASALFWDTLWRRYQEDYLDFLARQQETESQ